MLGGKPQWQGSSLKREPPQSPPSRILGREVPMAYGSKIQQRLRLPFLVRWKAAGNTDTLSECPHRDSLTGGHSPVLWWKEWQLRKPRDLWERTELSAFGAGTGGTGAIVFPVWSQHMCGLHGGAIFSRLNPPPKGLSLGLHWSGVIRACTLPW